MFVEPALVGGLFGKVDPLSTCTENVLTDRAEQPQGDDPSQGWVGECHPNEQSVQMSESLLRRAPVRRDMMQIPKGRANQIKQ